MKRRKWSPEVKRLLRTAPTKSELPGLEEERTVLREKVGAWTSSPGTKKSASLLLEVAALLRRVTPAPAFSPHPTFDEFSLADSLSVWSLLNFTETWHDQFQRCAGESEEWLHTQERRWRIMQTPSGIEATKATLKELRRLLAMDVAINASRRDLTALLELHRQLNHVLGRLNLAEAKVQFERDKIRGHEKAYAKASVRDKTARRKADSLKTAVRPTPNCPYCGNPIGDNPHLDHIVPVNSGGLAIPENLVYCCAACNLTKQNRGFLEFLFDRGLDVRVVFDRLRCMGKRI